MSDDLNQKTTVVRDVDEVPVEQRVVSTPVRTVGPGVVAARVIYYIAGVIIAFLLMRIILLLLAANQGSPFVDFVYTVSGFFAWPFYGIFSYQPSYGHSVLEVSSIVAIIVYGLVAMGLAKLFTLGSDRVDV